MYIPKKLQANFALIEEKQGSNIFVKGMLSCCKQHNFTIQYTGKLKTGLLGRISIFPENEAIVFMAKCEKCGKEIQVFNDHTDGYDGCVHTSISPPLLGFAGFSCPKCSNNYFSIELFFEYQSKAELEEDGVQEYENAFSWVRVSPTCTSCKRMFKNLINIETA